MTRLASDMWVSAYLTRLRMEAIPAFITSKGDATAGAVLVKIALMNGTAEAFQRRFDFETGDRIWMSLAQGDERDVDAAIAKQRDFDPDLWVVEVEDPKGRHLLEDPSHG